MTWMLTANGNEVDLMVMDPSTISIGDIAHHLAQINRFNGACGRPYSVAEHSLLVCEIAERELGLAARPLLLLAILMHDAHEAYIGDLLSPLKQVLGNAWRAVEDRIQMQVLGRFGLLDAFDEAQAICKRADLIALVTERVSLMPMGRHSWPVQEAYSKVTWAQLDQRQLTWQDWRQAFVDRFDELTFASGAVTL